MKKKRFSVEQITAVRWHRSGFALRAPWQIPFVERVIDGQGRALRWPVGLCRPASEWDGGGRLTKKDNTMIDRCRFLASTSGAALCPGARGARGATPARCHA